MKTKLIASVAFGLATVLAVPAFAQAAPRNAHQAYAAAPFDNGSRPLPHRSWDVYNTRDRYVGSDPDPNVRQMIDRDALEQDNGGY